MEKKIKELSEKLNIVTNIANKEELLKISKELDRLIEEYTREKENNK